MLDAGAFMAVERGDRQVVALVKRERLEGRVPLTHGGVVGQVWRTGRNHQAPLARLLGGVVVRPLDDSLGRRAGVLLGEIGRADVIDAAVVLLAQEGDEILTSDPEDLTDLARMAGTPVDLIRV